MTLTVYGAHCWGGHYSEAQQWLQLQSYEVCINWIHFWTLAWLQKLGQYSPIENTEWQVFDQYMIYMFCLDVYWTDILEISEINYVAVIGRFTFLSVFEKSKTAPVSLNSCLVIDADHKLVTEQCNVSL